MKGRLSCSIAHECPRKSCVMQLVFGFEDGQRGWMKCPLFNNRKYRVIKAKDDLAWVLKGRTWVIGKE